MIYWIIRFNIVDKFKMRYYTNKYSFDKSEVYNILNKEGCNFYFNSIHG